MGAEWPPYLGCEYNHSSESRCALFRCMIFFSILALAPGCVYTLAANVPNGAISPFHGRMSICC